MNLYKFHGDFLAFSLDSCSWDRLDLESENSNASARLAGVYCELLQEYMMSSSLRLWAIAEIYRRGRLSFCLHGTTVTSSASTVDAKSPKE